MLRDHQEGEAPMTNGEPDAATLVIFGSVEGYGNEVFALAAGGVDAEAATRKVAARVDAARQRYNDAPEETKEQVDWDLDDLMGWCVEAGLRPIRSFVKGPEWD